MTDERTCDTCKHFLILHAGVFTPPICERAMGDGYATVDGRKMDRRSIYYARREQGQCGPDGKLWEART